MADLFWNRLGWPGIEYFVGDIDVYHSSDWAQAPSKAFNVTTVHDLALVKYPLETDKRILSVHKRRLDLVMKNVNRAIVPSESARVDLVEFGVENNRIHVIAEGVGEVFKKRGENEVKSVKKRLGIVGEYILAVGTSKRKNLPRIIDSYKKVRDKVGVKNLIIAGDVSHNNIEDGVQYVGRITDDELSALYSGASTLVYASLYEGFGLTILQAFSCECPVVTSNISSMPEVAGEAAVLVDPRSSSSIASGIVKMMRHRSKYIKKGKLRVRAFSWDRMAKETLEVYKQAE